MLGYVVEVRSKGAQDWTEVISRCKNTSYHVQSGLEPQGLYRFRVRAYNSAGISEPSQESEWVNMATAGKRFVKCLRIFHVFCRLSRGLFVTSVYFFAFEEKKKEERMTYITVTIDTKHKVKDHYNVHEKLGV